MRIGWIGALALAGIALGLGAASAAEPAGADHPALQRAVSRGVLDADVLEALAEAGRVRALAVFHVSPGEAPHVAPDAARVRLLGEGLYPGRRFERIPALFGSFDAGALDLLLRDPRVRRVSLEPVVRPQLSEAVPLVGLDHLHGLGATGNGAKVVVIDTGVDLAHADLAGAVVAEQCYCDEGAPGPPGCCPNGFDQQSGPGSAQDAHGHGTRVASIVTSDGIHAPTGGAPAAQLAVVKVTGSSGSGSLPDLLSALDWALLNQSDADVLNLSLGFGLYTGHCDDADANTIALASVIGQLQSAGVLTVAGAGNDGSGSGIIAPACLEDSMSVGAVWDADVGSQSNFGCTDATTAADQVTCWSNSNAIIDVMAPGGRMTASRLGGTTVTRVGTSYATPIVSACAAAIAAEFPGATPQELRDVLRASLEFVVDAKNGLQFPRLDCAYSRALVLAEEVPVSGGWSALLSSGLLLGGLGVLVFAGRRGLAD